MPAKSAAQARFFGAELRRKQEGKESKTDTSEATMKEFASTPRKGLPERAPTLADRAKIRAKNRKK